MDKLWQAYGPNHSDDSRCTAPNLGIYRGEREVVVDWIDANHSGFRDHFEGRSHPMARLEEILPVEVTVEMVTELREARRESQKAAERMKKALMGSK